jgi:hypothetical protein
VFTPFHKPPYPYRYGRSVDKTTTIFILRNYFEKIESLLPFCFYPMQAIIAKETIYKREFISNTVARPKACF